MSKKSLEKCFSIIKSHSLNPLMKFGYFYFKLASDLTNGRTSDNFERVNPTERLNYFVELRRFVKMKYGKTVTNFKVFKNDYIKLKSKIKSLNIQRYYLIDCLREIYNHYNVNNIDLLYYMGNNIKRDISKISIILYKYDKLLSDTVKENINLVKSLISKYGYNKIPHVDKDDLFQQGCLGLYTGIHRFDFKQNTKLSTYAVYWINQHIYEYIKNNFQFKLPKDLLDDYAKLQKAFKSKSLDEFDSLEDLKEYSGLEDIDDFRLSQLLNILKPMDINDLGKKDRTDNEYNKFYKIDIMFGFGSNKNSLLLMVEKELKDELSKFLTETEFNVISYKFGLFGKPAHDNKDIVSILNLSKSVVNKSIKSGLEKLRNAPHIISLLTEFIKNEGEFAC